MMTIMTFVGMMGDAMIGVVGDDRDDRWFL
jgi:hypothetical protein